MANKAKKDKKNDKPSFGQRIRSWFKGIQAELRKVTWPEKPKFRKNLAAALLIIVLSVVVIFIFDQLASAFLNVTGFYDVEIAAPNQENPEIPDLNPEVLVEGDDAGADNTADAELADEAEEEQAGEDADEGKDATDTEKETEGK